MAEVLSPLIHQTNTISIPQSLPTSDPFQAAMSASTNTLSRNLPLPRNHYTNHTGSSGYRGASAAPVQSYTLKHSPQLRQESRIVSAPTQNLVQPPTALAPSTHNRQRYPAPDSISSISSMSSSDRVVGGNIPFSKDDALLFTSYQAPVLENEFEPIQDIYVTPAAHPQQPAPSPQKSISERFRRGHRRGESSVASATSDVSVASTAISTATMGQIFHAPQKVSVHSPLERPSQPMAISIPNRRRPQSSGAILEAGANTASSSPALAPQRVFSPQPFMQHNNQDMPRPPTATGIMQRPGSSSSVSRSGLSSDLARHTNNPPASSRPMTAESQQSSISHSPAVAAMAALNERDSGKGVKSRLRKAFSFGSIADLRAAANDTEPAAQRAKVRQEQFSHRLDDDQDVVPQRQRAGNTIYGGQNSSHLASTDNISISSTASSASLMLRKVGSGMRKGGRSLKGLFRPKSVVGVPSFDASLQASVGPISVVNVEAEREQVNVNADPHEQNGGGTAFPRLERNSADAVFQVGSIVQRRASDARRSIVGTEVEQAEVIAAVKRGILKRSITPLRLPSPVPAAMDGTDQRSVSSFGTRLERQQSPVPSITTHGFRRPETSKTTEPTSPSQDDYFTNLAKKANGPCTSKSLPGTPQGSSSKNITFSPRLQFFDVWSANDYDRRGEVATCNRLTPLLAQQIKEELNNFKMEMEVHELSKPYTHFF